MSVRTHLLLLLLPALTAACSLIPTQTSSSWPLPTLNYTEFQLDNGLRVIVHEDHRSPIVAVNVWYHVGSKNEPDGRTGFAHLFEHLMFNGSENYDDEFFRPLEEVGATNLNGTTNRDRTNYFANVPTTALDRLLWLESDRMGHLLGAVTQDKLDEQRGVVQNEKRQRANEPYAKVWDLIPTLSYPEGHPYSWTTIGSMEDLNSASLDDVQDWFRTWYGAANATIVIAGDVTAELARQRVEHYFGAIPAGPELQRPQRWEAPMADNRRASLVDQVPQPRIYRVYNVAANYTEDAVALQVAAQILGGGKSSRLYERLVYEEQLATSAGAYFSPGELGSQLYLIATLKPEADPAQVEAILDAELQRLRQAGPRPEELERVQRSLYAGVVRGLEQVGGFGGKSDQLAAAAVLAGDPDMWRQELIWLRDLQRRQLQQALQQWTDAGHLTLTVLPALQHSVADNDADRSALPAVKDAPQLRLPPTESITLNNGMQVVVAQLPGAPVTEFRWIRRGGTAADPQGQAGLGTLMMDVLDESAGDLDALELARRLEANGASIGSRAELDFFELSLSALAGWEDQPLLWFSQLLTQPQFSAVELERRRDQQLAGIEQERASPFSLGLRTLPPLLFGEDHPYAQPLTGSGHPESVQTLSTEDLRNHAQGMLHPQDSTLLVVGDWTLEDVRARLPRTLLEWSPSSAAAPAPSLPRVPLSSTATLYLLDRPQAPQSLILAGHLLPPDTPEGDLALNMANTLYGGLFTSRLNMNLREDKAWSYGARSAIVSTQGQQPWVNYTRVQTPYTAAAVQEIQAEIRRMQQRGTVAEEELSRAARNRALRLPGQHETTAQVAASLLSQIMRERPADYLAELPVRLQSLRPEQVENAAKQHFLPTQLQWVIVGDVSKILPDLEKIPGLQIQHLEDLP